MSPFVTFTCELLADPAYASSAVEIRKAFDALDLEGDGNPDAIEFARAVEWICNQRRHSVDERMATWLLRMHDRVEGDVLPVTQDAIAELLGVRRTTVTLAALKLKEAGAIRSHGRGSIKIDRRRLEAASCHCYELMSHRINGIVSQYGVKILQSPRADWLG